MRAVLDFESSRGIWLLIQVRRQLGSKGLVNHQAQMCSVDCFYVFGRKSFGYADTQANVGQAAGKETGGETGSAGGKCGTRCSRGRKERMQGRAA